MLILTSGLSRHKKIMVAARKICAANLLQAEGMIMSYEQELMELSENGESPATTDIDTLRVLVQQRYMDMPAEKAEAVFGEALGADNDLFRDLYITVTGLMADPFDTDEIHAKIGKQLCEMVAEYSRDDCQHDFEEEDHSEQMAMDSAADAKCTQMMEENRCAA
ncbi:MAG: hypothetical protein R8M45_09585 [Ghiorsea sp.]